MRRIENPMDDFRNRKVTYELDDGRRVDVDPRLIQEIGLRKVMERLGVEMPAERIPVFHHGERVGTVPAEFDPAFIKSKSFFYDPRPGDFTRIAEGWQVSHTMGPGDVASVPGFQAEVRTHREHW